MLCAITVDEEISVNYAYSFLILCGKIRGNIMNLEIEVS